MIVETPIRTTAPPLATRSPEELRFPSLRLLGILFLFSGASSLIFETLFSRLLTYTFGNTAPAVSTVPAAFPGGLALGVFFIGRSIDRRRPSIGLVAHGLLLLEATGSYATLWLASMLNIVLGLRFLAFLVAMKPQRKLAFLSACTRRRTGRPDHGHRVLQHEHVADQRRISRQQYRGNPGPGALRCHRNAFHP